MTFKSLKPLGKRIYGVIRPVEEKKTTGGIIVADKHSELTRVGEVLEVGPDVTKIKKGDKFLILFHAGSVIDAGDNFLATDDTHRIIDESEILAIIEE